MKSVTCKSVTFSCWNSSILFYPKIILIIFCLSLGSEPYTTVHPHLVIWVVREQKNADGKMGLLWAISDTLKKDLSGQAAVLPVFIIFSSKILGDCFEIFFVTISVPLLIIRGCIFSGDTATCLFNSPHEDESLPRVLPGKLLSLDAQCRKDRGTSACFVSLSYLLL